MHCAEVFAWDRDTCPDCGTYQAAPPKLNVWGLGFMQNRLRRLVVDGEVAEPIAARLIGLLRQEQLVALGKVAPLPPAPAQARGPIDDPAAPEATLSAPAPPVAPAIERAHALTADRAGTSAAFASGLAGPNLLLYLGAFLIVVSGLILVGITPEDLSEQLKLVLGIGGTLGFLAAGVALHRNETVRPAARTFLLLGAVLVPLDAWSVGTVVLDVHHPARQNLLLAGSVLSAALYAVLAKRGYGVHFVYLTAIALAGAAEGVAQTLALDASSRLVPHFTVAAALIVAARSQRTSLAPLSRAPEGLVVSIEAYAGILVAALVSMRILPVQALDAPSLLAASVFAAAARGRVAADRREFWGWTAVAAAAAGVFGLVPRDASAVARVAVLLGMAAVLWIPPPLWRPLRWMVTPGGIISWVAVGAALFVGITTTADARTLAFAGSTARLAHLAWATRHRPDPTTALHPALLGALLSAYVLWLSALQVASVLPAALERDPTRLAWSTFAAYVATWTATLLLARTRHAWTLDVRAASHALAGLALVLMLSAGVPRPPRADGVAIGTSLALLAAALSGAYAFGIPQRRVLESLGIAVALGVAAVLGGVETIIGRATVFATLTASLIGTIALAIVPIVSASYRSSMTSGAVAALVLALIAQAVYRNVTPELTAVLTLVLTALAVCTLVPQIERALRWTFPAAFTAIAFLLARTATNAMAIDPQLATLPFTTILIAGASLARPLRGDASAARRLLLTGVLALSAAAALSLGRYGPSWSPAPAAVVMGVIALLALRLADVALAGAAVALAVLVVETTIRHTGIRDILVQGLMYGVAVLGAARFLGYRALLGDTPTTRAIYAIAVGLLTLPAFVRAAQPDGWWAVAYLALLSGALLSVAVALRQHAIGIVGSVVGLVAIVTGMHQARVVETLVYTTAVGAYLTGFGLYLGRTRSVAHLVTGDMLVLIKWSGALLLLIPAVVRSWAGAEYGVVFFVLLGLILAGGLLLRQRSMLGAAAGAVGLEAIWVVTTVARLLPFWLLFAIAGLTLLAVGTVLVFRRDLLERVQARFESQWEIAE